MADDGADKVKAEAINLTVKDQMGGEVQFKVKPSTKFSKILVAFCEKKGLNPQNVRLIFDGQRIAHEQTPAELDMQDGDVIDCMIEQTGGASQC